MRSSVSIQTNETINLVNFLSDEYSLWRDNEIKWRKLYDGKSSIFFLLFFFFVFYKCSVKPNVRVKKWWQWVRGSLWKRCARFVIIVISIIIIKNWIKHERNQFAIAMNINFYWTQLKRLQMLLLALIMCNINENAKKLKETQAKIN